MGDLEYEDATGHIPPLLLVSDQYAAHLPSASSLGASSFANFNLPHLILCALLCVCRFSAAVDLFFAHAERYECVDVPNAEDLALDASADPEVAQAAAEAVRARAAALTGEAGVPPIYFVITIIGSLLLALVRWIRRPPLKPHIN